MSNLVISEVVKSNSGDEAIVISFPTASTCVIRYLDSYEYEKELKVGNVVRGKFKNPFSPSVFGIGYIGVGKYRSSKNKSRKKTLEYQAWKDMLKRCYSIKFLSNNACYFDCKVCEEWHNFQVFAEWYTNHRSYGLGYHLDKDLLVRGNKIYSPTNCCLLPPEVNASIIQKDLHKGKDAPKGVQVTPSGKYAVSVRGLQGGSYIGTYTTIKEAEMVRDSANKLRFSQLHDKYEKILSEKEKYAILHWQ